MRSSTASKPTVSLDIFGGVFDSELLMMISANDVSWSSTIGRASTAVGWASRDLIADMMRFVE